LVDIKENSVAECSVVVSSVHNGVRDVRLTGELKQLCAAGESVPLTLDQAGAVELTAEEIFGECDTSILSFTHNQDLIEIIFLRAPLNTPVLPVSPP